MHYFPMKLNRTALAALICSAALGLGACGGDDSGNGNAEDTAPAEDTAAAESSPDKQDPDADSTAPESTTTADDDAEGDGADGDEATATSPGGAISLTTNTVPISGPNPRITVTWEAEPNAGDQCLMVLTRTDPRGYLLGVEEIDECSGSHDFTLVHGVAADADDVAGDHVIEMDNLDEKATVTATVPE